jgi:hypothetical protein
LSLRATGLRPFELGHDHILEARHEHRRAEHLDTRATGKLDLRERSGLAWDEIGLPAGAHVDHVEERLVLERLHRRFLGHIEARFRQ